MADYPLSSATIDTESAEEGWPDKRLMSTSRGGTPRQRLLASAKGRVFRFTHVGLTAANKTAMETFYDANRDNTFNFTWFGSIFVVMFNDEEGLKWQPMADSKWRLPMRLIKA